MFLNYRRKLNKQYQLRLMFVQLLDGQLLSQSKILQIYENVSTVRCSELGFYEVMQKLSEDSMTTCTEHERYHERLRDEHHTITERFPKSF